MSGKTYCLLLLLGFCQRSMSEPQRTSGESLLFFKSICRAIYETFPLRLITLCHTFFRPLKFCPKQNDQLLKEFFFRFKYYKNINVSKIRFVSPLGIDKV